jgi:hypothetical protein
VNKSPSVTTVEMDFSDLLNTLRPKEGGAGYRTQEICEITGESEKRVAKALRAGIEAGRVIRSEKKYTDIGGRVQTVPAYILVNPINEIFSDHPS